MLGVVVVAAGGDLKNRVTLGEHAPYGALAPAESPAGLVHVDRARRADTRKDVVAGLGQRVGGPREDRVDRAGAERDPNSCSQSSTRSRRLMRLRTDSTAIAA